MSLDLYMEIQPHVIIYVFISAAVMSVIIALAKTAIALETLNSKKKKEVKKNDNRGNKEGSSKVDVHEPR